MEQLKRKWKKASLRQNHANIADMEVKEKESEAHTRHISLTQDETAQKRLFPGMAHFHLASQRNHAPPTLSRRRRHDDFNEKRVSERGRGGSKTL